jgi:hypothetical protein
MLAFASMSTPGKLEVVVKFSVLPTDVTTDANGSKSFTLTCDERTVQVTLRPKNFAKIEKALAEWPSWVAAINGGMGKADGTGFAIKDPIVQVFERKPKEAPSTSQ